MSRELFSVALQIAQDESQLTSSLMRVTYIIILGVVLYAGPFPQYSAVFCLVQSQVFVHTASLLYIILLLYGRVSGSVVGLSLGRYVIITTAVVVANSNSFLSFLHKSAKLSLGGRLYCKSEGNTHAHLHHQMAFSHFLFCLINNGYNKLKSSFEAFQLYFNAAKVQIYSITSKYFPQKISKKYHSLRHF